MGLPASGVMGIKLKGANDRVTGFAVVRPRSDLFAITSDGKAKRSPLSEYPTQGRYGQGVIGARFGTGEFLAGGCVVQANDPVVLITEKGAAKTLLAHNAPRAGRATQGEEVIALREDDIVVEVLAPREEKDVGEP